MTDTTNATDSPNADAGAVAAAPANPALALASVGGEAAASADAGKATPEAGKDAPAIEGDKGAKTEPNAKAAEGAQEDKAKDGAPETYEDFKLPDTVELNPEAMTEWKEQAKALNLKQEDAQKLVDRGAQLVDNTIKQVMESQVKQYAEKVDGWHTTRKADSEIGGTEEAQTKALAAARKVADALGGSTDVDKNPFMKALTETGAGNHPEVIRVLYRLREIVGEDGKLINPIGGSGSVLTEAQKLYPNLPAA